MKRVLVLISTWNGDRFLDAQLSSIMEQSFDGRIDLLVRDDGSSDATLQLLAKCDPSRLTVIRGNNLGATASFLELMRLARHIPADYYALADQDDVWYPEKIARAVNFLASGTSPALYCSALRLVDENLNFLSLVRHAGDRTFVSSLLRNFATGCTCVFNRSMLETMRFPEDPRQILMHDWWLANTAAACGRIVYDDQPFINYRQHSSNHIGMSTGLRGLARRIAIFMAGTGSPSRLTQARALQTAYEGTWPAPVQKALYSFTTSTSVFGRIGFVWTHRAHIDSVPAIRFVLRP